MNIKVSSEIGRLRKVLIHSPDGGIGNVPTNKLHDWLYDDIVDVKKIQDEYSLFQVLLLLFLDPKVLFSADGSFLLLEDGKAIKNEEKLRIFENNPEKENYFVNDNNIKDTCVLDTQFLLQYLFREHSEKAKYLIEGICSIEGVHTYRKNDILAIINEAIELKEIDTKKSQELFVEVVKILLTGKIDYEKIDIGSIKNHEGEDACYIFPPIPNFIFTRDIGVTIGNYLLITKPRFYIRKREVILMRFIAENFLFPDKSDHFKIIDVSEDDDYFQTEEKDQPEKRVNYEGGDIMMISSRHLLIGCSERTSPYAIQKLVNRIFWENIETESESGIDLISVIKISEKRSQMHIDTILSHVREDVWIIHSPLSEDWKKKQLGKELSEESYIDELTQKSENQLEKEKDVTILQFYLNPDSKQLKKDYESANEKGKRELKSEFKKRNFLLKAENKEPNNEKNKYATCEGCPYKKKPEGLHDLLKQISQEEFKKEKVKFIFSGGGDVPHDGREQWTDACNLLILRSGVAVGYDRNYRTAKHFNEKMLGDEVSTFPGLIDTIIKSNKDRFKNTKDSDGNDMDLKHILHVEDLIKFIVLEKLDLVKTIELVYSIKNTLILLPSNELSRARGGSHCMSMPLIRD